MRSLARTMGGAVMGCTWLRVVLVNTPPREASSGRTVNDPGKRIASIVSGEPSYVVTQDGSRYFPGAVLPSGHRIQQILPNEVVLDLHGQSSRLSF